MSAYEILKCSEESSEEELKKSYHQLLLVHHPDKQNANNLDDFFRIQWAYKLLSDRNRRAEYDSLLRQASLKEKADNLVSQNDDESSTHLLLINKDFDFDSDKAEYSRQCRCGSFYVLTKQLVKDLLESSIDGQNSKQELKNSLVICLECDTCSLCVNVLII